MKRCRRTVKRAQRPKRFAVGGAHQMVLSTSGFTPARYTLTLTARDAAGNRSRAVALALNVLPQPVLVWHPRKHT